MPAAVTLIKKRIHAGHWEGVVTAEGDQTDPPRIDVTHLEKPLDDVTLTADPKVPGQWALRVPIPAEVLRDGVQTFVIHDLGSGERLDSFTVITGQPLEDDIRAEVDLLREELDMLKRAFRRHCLEVLGS